MSPRVRQSGFSLIELLVAVVIGMVGILAIYQSFSVWEDRRRTVSSGSESLVSGAVAIYLLDRDLKLGGMGFGPSLTKCDLTIYNSKISPSTLTFPMVAASIDQGTSGAPDRINVFYGNSAYLTAGQKFDGSTASTKTLTTGNAGFQAGDRVVATDGGTACTMFEVTSTNNTDGHTISHVTSGNYLSFYTGASVDVTANDPGGSPLYSGGGTLYDLGPEPKRNVWFIDTDTSSTSTAGLTLKRYDSLSEVATAATVMAEGAIDLQAQYGTSAAGITTWSDTAPTDPTKLIGLRVALLMRSSQFEKTAVTANMPTYFGGANTFSLPNTYADGTAWDHYRYEVHETWVSFRNMQWGNMP